MYNFCMCCEGAVFFSGERMSASAVKRRRIECSCDGKVERRRDLEKVTEKYFFVTCRKIYFGTAIRCSMTHARRSRACVDGMQSVIFGREKTGLKFGACRRTPSPCRRAFAGRPAAGRGVRSASGAGFGAVRRDHRIFQAEGLHGRIGPHQPADRFQIRSGVA